MQVPLNASKSTGCLTQRCTNPVAWSTEYNVFRKIFIVLSLHKFVYQFTYTRQKATDNNTFHRPLQSGGSEYRNYFMSAFWHLRV